MGVASTADAERTQVEHVRSKSLDIPLEKISGVDDIRFKWFNGAQLVATQAAGGDLLRETLEIEIWLTFGSDDGYATCDKAVTEHWLTEDLVKSWKNNKKWLNKVAAHLLGKIVSVKLEEVKTFRKHSLSDELAIAVELNMGRGIGITDTTIWADNFIQNHHLTPEEVREMEESMDDAMFEEELADNKEEGLL